MNAREFMIIHRAVLFTLLLFVAQANNVVAQSDPPSADLLRETTRTDVIDFINNPQGIVYTEWAEFETDQSYWFEMVSARMFLVRTEGRLFEGRNQYRKGYRNFAKALPGVKPYGRISHKGMYHQSFMEKNHRYFLRGYSLAYVQVFNDVAGRPRYQALWIKMPAQ